MKRPADNRRLRRFTPEEYRRLGVALPEAKSVGEIDQVINGNWLLVLSGCRLGEIINLKWSEMAADSDESRRALGEFSAILRGRSRSGRA